MGTQKSVPVDEPDDFAVAFRQPDGRNRGGTLESWKAGHSARMRPPRKTWETIGFAYEGNFNSELARSHFKPTSKKPVVTMG